MQQMDCVSLTQVIEIVYMMIMIKQLSSLPIFKDIAKMKSAYSQPNPQNLENMPPQNNDEVYQEKRRASSLY